MMDNNSLDFEFMNEAIKLAANGLFTTDPNPRVGCVLVKNNEIIGKGWHQKAGEPHAEIHALQQAGSNAKGSTVYVSLEPCSHHGKTPPCSDALITAKVKRVVVAMQDPNPMVAGKGIKKLSDAGISTSSGILQEQSRILNPGFIKRMTKGLPYVRCKIAMSLDGRTCMKNGESKWITGVESRQDAHILRAGSSAVLTGIGTILADDPSLNARVAGAEINQPAVIILDRSLRIPESSRVFITGNPVYIFTTSHNEAKINSLKDQGAIVIQVNEVDLLNVLKHSAKLELNELLVEAGPILVGAMTNARLIDEFVIYQAPVIMGNSARGAFDVPQIKSMNDRVFLDIMDSRSVGHDTKLIARFKEK